MALGLLPPPGAGAPPAARAAAAQAVLALPALPPLGRQLFQLDQSALAASGGAMSQSSGTSGAAAASQPAAGVAIKAEVSILGSWQADAWAAAGASGGTSDMARKRWRADADAALGLSSPAADWQGQHDAITAVPLNPAWPPTHCAADGSCASAVLEETSPAGFSGSGCSTAAGVAALVRPWLAASPLTAAPWKRMRMDPYGD